jgi:2-isopropylmalate synthase
VGVDWRGVGRIVGTVATDTRIEIYDTTLRDGTQGEGFTLSLHDKLLIARRLDEFGVDYIEGGFPGSNPKDVAFFAQARGIGFKHAKLAAFGMTRRRGVRAEDDPGLRALVDAGTPVVTIVGKTSKFQAERVLGVSPGENVDMIGESVKFVTGAGGGRAVVYDAEHFFDAFSADADYAISTLRAADGAGATVLVLCDTNGGTMPELVADAVARVRQALPGARIGIHTHNDSGLAVACALAAIRAGASHAQGTINGVGERCGNMDLTTLMANLKLKYNLPCLRETSLEQLTELSRYVYDLSNTSPASGQPYTGTSAFAHKGGMHVHAVQKDASTYEHVDPARIGNVRKILISELSGASNIAATAGKRFGLENDKPTLKRVLDKVCDLENRGYAFEVAEASFDLLVRKEIGRYREFFTLQQYRVEILSSAGDEPVSEATVKLTVEGRARHEVAEGDGPVAAIDAALRKALLPAYPGLGRLHLVDYKVRIVSTTQSPQMAEAASVVRVVAQFRRELGNNSGGGESFFGTVGVSVNIIDASYQALRDAYEHHLLIETESGAAGGNESAR